MKIRLATRRSRLALTQSRWVAQELRKHQPELSVEEIHVVTEGDRVVDKPLYAVGGKGLFVSEVEATLARGEADIAVHSLKDVPGDQDFPEGLGLVCVPKREDARDVLLTRDGGDLDALPNGARVGTTSLRRTCQLKAQRPDLRFVTLRGNVDSRLAKLDAGKFDAIVLAAAGLVRLGLLEGRAHWMIPTHRCLPAVGQGTLAIEAAVEPGAVTRCLEPLEDVDTRVVTTAERAFLRTLQGNCSVPIAGYAELLDDGSRVSMEGLVGSPEGERVLQARGDVFVQSRDGRVRCEQARQLGTQIAEQLIEQGAREIIAEAEASLARRTGLN